jgi:two-component system NarL family sensor kinase
MTDQERLTRMLVSAINARQIESDRVSRKLHDEVGQVLSAVGLQLDVLKLDYRQQTPAIVEQVNQIQEMLERAMTEVRALSYDLNPAVVERVGLQNALDRLIGRTRSRTEGTIRFLFDSSVRVPLETANVWYKIAEQALDNSVLHANATKIEVHVKPAGRNALLEIRDNGIGFSPEQVRREALGIGLMLMDHHARQAGLNIDIQSTPGKGTTIRCTCPVREEPIPVVEVQSISGFAARLPGVADSTQRKKAKG